MTRQAVLYEGAFTQDTRNVVNQNFAELYGNLLEGNFRFVHTPDDLPSAVGGVHTLEDDKTYFFTDIVDLEGNRLVAGQNTTILGGSSENSRIKSTGLTGTALITSAWSLPMRGITIEADLALDLDADGNSGQALDWFGVNFTDCATIGTIANYSNVIWTDCAILNSKGLTFDGTMGTIGFGSCIFDVAASGTAIIIPATATITRRFRIIYSAFVVGSGETGINVNSSATIPVEGYILDTVNFAGGGTYTTGVAYTDNKALFVNNRGISNSAEIAYYTMNGNATATTISGTNTPVKVAGTTTSQAITQKFTNTDNRATYTGAIARSFEVTVVLSFTSSANNVIGTYIAKSGSVIENSETYSTANASGRAENVVCQTVVDLAQNEYLEVFVENTTGANNITVSDLSVIVRALN